MTKASIKFIKLTQGQFAIVDETNFEWINKFKWQALRDGNTFYAKRSFKAKSKRTLKLMHREIMGAKKGQQIDHVNTDGIDNREINLRYCNNSQNAFNRGPKTGGNKYKGMSWNKTKNRWYASIEIAGKSVHLGCFLSEDAAAKAYDTAAKKHHGKFARLNFPNE